MVYDEALELHKAVTFGLQILFNQAEKSLKKGPSDPPKKGVGGPKRGGRPPKKGSQAPKSDFLVNPVQQSQKITYFDPKTIKKSKKGSKRRPSPGPPPGN
jgi:hypothetical protein